MQNHNMDKYELSVMALCLILDRFKKKGIPPEFIEYIQFFTEIIDADPRSLVVEECMCIETLLEYKKNHPNNYWVKNYMCSYCEDLEQEKKDSGLKRSS